MRLEISNYHINGSRLGWSVPLLNGSHSQIDFDGFGKPCQYDMIILRDVGMWWTLFDPAFVKSVDYLPLNHILWSQTKEGS